jgi:hypothetical protein
MLALTFQSAETMNPERATTKPLAVTGDGKLAQTFKKGVDITALVTVA